MAGIAQCRERPVTTRSFCGSKRIEGQSGGSETRLALFRTAGDARRLVRIRAAAALGECPLDFIPPNERNRVESAFRELEEALQSRADDWAAIYSLGNFYLDRNQLDRARESFERAGLLRPDALMPWVNLSIARARLGDNAGAEQALRKSLEVQPDSAVARFNLALVEAEKGDIAAAERLLREALKTEPRMAEAAYNLGVLLGGKGEYREAVQWCRRAVALRPEEARYTEAVALYRRQQRQ